MINDFIFIFIFFFLFSIVFYILFIKVFAKKNNLYFFYSSLLLILLPSLYLYLPFGYSLGVIEDREIKTLIEKNKYLKNENERRENLKLIKSMLIDSKPLKDINTEKIILLADIYDNTNDFERLDKVYNILIDRFPNDHNYYALLAQSIFLNIDMYTDRRSKMNEIISLLDKSLTINPDQPLALSIFGMIAYGNKQYQEAIGFWDRAIKLYGENSPESDSLIKGIISSQQQINIK